MRKVEAFSENIPQVAAGEENQTFKKNLSED